MIGDDDNNNRSFDSIRYMCVMAKKMRIDEWMSKSESNRENKWMRERGRHEGGGGEKRAIMCNFHIKPDSDWAFDLVWRAKINDVIECDKRLIILKQLPEKSTAPCRRPPHFNRKTSRICWFMLENGPTGKTPPPKLTLRFFVRSTTVCLRIHDLQSHVNAKQFSWLEPKMWFNRSGMGKTYCSLWIHWCARFVWNLGLPNRTGQM